MSLTVSNGYPSLPTITGVDEQHHQLPDTGNDVQQAETAVPAQGPTSEAPAAVQAEQPKKGFTLFEQTPFLPTIRFGGDAVHNQLPGTGPEGQKEVAAAPVQQTNEVSTAIQAEQKKGYTLFENIAFLPTIKFGADVSSANAKPEIAATTPTESSSPVQTVEEKPTDAEGSIEQPAAVPSTQPEVSVALPAVIEEKPASDEAAKAEPVVSSPAQPEVQVLPTIVEEKVTAEEPAVASLTQPEVSVAVPAVVEEKPASDEAPKAEPVVSSSAQPEVQILPTVVEEKPASEEPAKAEPVVSSSTQPEVQVPPTVVEEKPTAEEPVVASSAQPETQVQPSVADQKPEIAVVPDAATSKPEKLPETPKPAAAQVSSEPSGSMAVVPRKPSDKPKPAAPARPTPHASFVPHAAPSMVPGADALRNSRIRQQLDAELDAKLASRQGMNNEIDKILTIFPQRMHVRISPSLETAKDVLVQVPLELKKRFVVETRELATKTHDGHSTTGVIGKISQITDRILKAATGNDKKDAETKKPDTAKKQEVKHDKKHDKTHDKKHDKTHDKKHDKQDKTHDKKHAVKGSHEDPIDLEEDVVSATLTKVKSATELTRKEVPSWAKRYVHIVKA